MIYQLENEKKKIEQEESKFNAEIDKIKEQLKSAAQDEMDALKQRTLNKKHSEETV